MPRPCQDRPGLGTSAVSGRLIFEPALRNLPVAVTRIKGCQSSFTIVLKSHRAYSPRSVMTTTVQPAGIRFRNALSSVSHSGFQACLTLPRRTFQATGRAEPR